jgi:hypothetical protein
VKQGLLDQPAHRATQARRVQREFKVTLVRKVRLGCKAIPVQRALRETPVRPVLKVTQAHKVLLVLKAMSVQQGQPVPRDQRAK